MTDDEVREANDDWVCDRLESIHIIALRSLDGQHDMRRAMEEIAGLSEGFAKIPATETCAHQHPDRKPDDTYCRDCGEHF